nr:angiopoietin-1 receptor-like [Lytechinus pictus]
MQERVEYQCYRSLVDSDATLEFGRYISTRSNETELPSSVSHSKNQDDLQVVKFRGAMKDQAYGVFYCRGTKADRDPTSVLSFFIRSDAKLIPVADAFTRTVSIGEVGVEIAMTVVRPSEQPGAITQWRFNGSKPVESQDNRTTYRIDRPVTVEDDGIYEVYFEGERDWAKGGFFRLIVRACPPNRWGPPDCEGVCDKCYNGGVCDDKSGMCVCPNGFMGPNCLTICNPGGGNRFGLNCEFRCSYKTDRDYQCRGALFCLPDPFGCSCDLGSKGLSCRVVADVCEADYYGEDCTFKCHCLNGAPCNKSTGECQIGLCARNFATYDGTPECQACKGLSYGFNCSQECHCDEEACDLKIGRCNGKCLNNWLPPNCIRGVSRITTNPKVNPGQPSNITCHVYGNPPPSFDTIYLTSDLGKSSSTATGIVSRSVAVTGSETVIVFDVAAIEEGEVFSCLLAEESQIAILEVESSTYDLPVISKPLEVTFIGTHEITVEWEPWQPDIDEGDVPLTEYIVVYHNLTSPDDWMEAVSLTPDQNLTVSITGLRSDTDYEFAVAGVRAGPDGIGLPGPAIRVTTHCERPNIRSFNLTVTSTAARQIELTWEKPAESKARCRGGFQTFTIVYSKRDSQDNETQLDVPFTDPPMYTIADLEVCTEYVIRIGASNKFSHSAFSEPVNAQTTAEGKVYGF